MEFQGSSCSARLLLDTHSIGFLGVSQSAFVGKLQKGPVLRFMVGKVTKRYNSRMRAVKRLVAKRQGEEDAAINWKKVSTEVPTKVSNQVVEVRLSCFHLFFSLATLLFLGPLEAPTMNSPERVRDTIRTSTAVIAL